LELRLYNVSMSKTNKQYFFILGNNAELSVAEIVAIFKCENIEHSIDLAINSVLIISCDEISKDFFDRLGGSKKFGEICKKVDSFNNIDFDKFLGQYLGDDKFRFGFSFYNFSKSELKKGQLSMRKFGLNYKKELKTKDVKSRLVESREPELSSVIVHKEKMIDSGADVVLIKYKDEVYYGRTLAVQDYNAFSARDYGKPGRDSASGMIPPKLARMMLNLSARKNDKLVLDPFCGSGTIILEALALGFDKILGSDKSARAIDDTESNLIWWQQHNVLDETPLIQKFSVENLDRNYKLNSIDAIITEPYLGPPLKGYENQDQIRKIRNELQELYKITLKQFAKVLKPGGIVVMVWPVFVDKKNNQLFLKLFDTVEELNFTPIDYLEKSELDIDRLTQYRNTYYYCREGQRVCREIVVLEKKK
jgi:tRNA G10  N-methylase Trm11